MEVEKSVGTKQILEEIFRTGKITDSTGKEYPLNSNIDTKEGGFLQKIIIENACVTTIEVGCAYGISSLFICDALSANAEHTIIDPFQSTDWKNIGVTQLQRANVKNFKLIEKVSETALPELLAAGAKFDFAFIDGWHTFDHTLLDMFYMNKMLKVGGTLVIDDVGMKGVQKAVNYFLNYPAYRFAGGVSLLNTAKRNTFSKFVLNPLRGLARLVPAKVREEIFSPEIVKKRSQGYSMVALKKIKEDDRPWNWYETF